MTSIYIPPWRIDVTARAAVKTPLSAAAIAKVAARRFERGRRARAGEPGRVRVRRQGADSAQRAAHARARTNGRALVSAADAVGVPPEQRRSRAGERHRHTSHASAQPGQRANTNAPRGLPLFHQTGPAGVEVVLLSLADFLGTYGDSPPPTEEWNHLLDVCSELLRAYFERPEEVIRPPALLTGDDLLGEFGLKPGPQVGQILAELREAQAAGEVADRPAAAEWVRQYLAGRSAGAAK